MSDTSFEQKFGQLADATISEKLPALHEHRVGFQVIKQDIDGEEDDKTNSAIGVQAFLIGDTWLYMPLFFADGRVRGHELLYVLQKDLFVPSMDGWINSLSSNGAKDLGYMEDSDRYEVGPSDVDVQESTFSTFKYASSNPSGDILDQDKVNKMMSKLGEAMQVPTLEGALSGMGKTASSTFANTFVHDADFANACLSVYTSDQMYKIAADAIKRGEDKEETVTKDVNIISDITSEDAKNLDDREKSLLVNNGVFVQDRRTNFSQVYQEQVDSMTMSNISTTGIYDIITNDGSLIRCMALNPSSHYKTRDMYRYSKPCKREYNDNARTMTLVILEGEKLGKTVTAKSTEVYGKPVSYSDKVLKPVLGKAKSASKQTLAALLKGKDKWETENVILISPNGDMVSVNLRKDDNTKELEACGNRYLSFGAAKSKLADTDDYVNIPEGTYFFPSSEVTIRLGTPRAFQEAARRFTEDLSLKSSPTGDFLSVNKGTMLPKHAAVEVLCNEYGIHGVSALTMIKEASDASHGYKKFLLKRASTSKANVPHKKINSVKTTTTTSKGKAMMPQKAIETVGRFASQGIKELLDVSVIQSLLDNADLAELTEDFLVAITKGMDSTGRLLLTLYVHSAYFEEQYGKDKLQDIVKTVKSLFRQSGDVVLCLREKDLFSAHSTSHTSGMLSDNITVG